MALTIQNPKTIRLHQKGQAASVNFNIVVHGDGTWYFFNDPSGVFRINGQSVSEIVSSETDSVNIQLTNAINSWDDGVYEFEFKTMDFYGNPGETAVLILAVTSIDDDLVWPKKLSFEAVRNVVKAEPKSFYIFTAHSGVVINLPEWMALESHELNSDAHEVVVKPTPYFLLTPEKKYIGEISIEIPDETSPRKINVDYTIHAGYDETYTKTVHFTKDHDELIFFKTTPENSFLSLHVNARIFNSVGELHKDFDLVLDIPFVDFRAKINIGKEIEPYLFSDFEPIFKNKIKGDYPPVELRMVAIEIKADDYTILNQDILPLQYYLRGKNPLTSESVDAYFWTEARPKIMQMVSSGAVVSLGIFKPAFAPVPSLTMKKNGSFVKNIVPNLQGLGSQKPYFCSVNVNLTNTEPGDVISFEHADLPTRKFLIGTPQKTSIQIAFLNQFNTYEWLEFTGGFSGEVEYTHNLVEQLRAYLPKTKKINGSKSQKITINSGWMLKDEIFKVDELIESRRAFMLFDNLLAPTAQSYEYESADKIELIPVSSKITNIDSENDMIQFDVEFIINPKNENQTYTRRI